MLEATASSDSPRGNEVVQRQGVERMERTPWTLHSLVHGLSRRIDRVGIVTGGSSILDVELRFELLEAFGASIVDILSVGDERRRRRSTGSRHFEWRTG